MLPNYVDVSTKHGQFKKKTIGDIKSLQSSVLYIPVNVYGFDAVVINNSLHLILRLAVCILVVIVRNHELWFESCVGVADGRIFIYINTIASTFVHW